MTTKTHRERVPFSTNRKRLSVKKIDGYFTRFFNDIDDRVQRALDAGYEFVKPDEIGSVGDKEVHGGNSDLNSKVSRVVGRDSNNKAIRAYLLKIRLAFYEEDKAKKEETNRLVDDAVRAGKAGGASIENQYGNVDFKQA